MVMPADTPTWLRFALETLTAASVQAEQRFAAVEAQLDRLAAAQEQTASRLDAFMASTERRIDGLESVERRLESVERLIATLDARVDAFVASTEQRFATVEAQLDRINGQLSTHTTEIGSLKGMAWEQHVIRHAESFLSDVARRIHVLSAAELENVIDTTIEMGRISDDEAHEVLRADLVARARDPNDGKQIFVVAEISVRVATRDVERAGRRATIAAKFGAPAVGVVVGQRIDRDAANGAETSGVQQVIAEDA